MRRLVKYSTVVLLATLVSGTPAVGQNLIRNGSFEDVPPEPAPQFGQALLPNDWIQIVLPTLGADTYSNDGSYGLAPAAFGNFPGVTAFDGIRWVAGWSNIPEAFGQQLSSPLTPGVRYTLSAYLIQAKRVDLDHPGGYEVSLSSAPNTSGTVLGTLGPTTDLDSWEQSSFVFTAPADAETLSYIVFNPIFTSTPEAYAGLDLVTLEAALQVIVDIKPGSDSNSINLGSGGNVPVAIFSTNTFDATTIDPTSVTLADAGLQLRGKGIPAVSKEDVDGDGLLDLVVHIDTSLLNLTDGDIVAELKGLTSDGQPIQGWDTVRIVP